MDDSQKSAAIQSAARLVIAVIGAVAAALGHHLDPGILQTLDIAAGAFLVAVSAAWSQWNAHQIEAKAKAREALALNSGVFLKERVTGTMPLVPASDVPALLAIVVPQLPPIPATPSVHAEVAEALSKPPLKPDRMPP